MEPTQPTPEAAYVLREIKCTKNTHGALITFQLQDATGKVGNLQCQIVKPTVPQQPLVAEQLRDVFRLLESSYGIALLPAKRASVDAAVQGQIYGSQPEA
jgi:hypothetical protein